MVARVEGGLCVFLAEEFVEWDCSREKESLAEGASETGEGFCLSGGLDAFSDDLETEAAGQQDNSGHDCRIGIDGAEFGASRSGGAWVKRNRTRHCLSPACRQVQ